MYGPRPSRSWDDPQCSQDTRFPKAQAWLSSPFGRRSPGYQAVASIMCRISPGLPRQSRLCSPSATASIKPPSLASAGGFSPPNPRPSTGCLMSMPLDDKFFESAPVLLGRHAWLARRPPLLIRRPRLEPSFTVRLGPARYVQTRRQNQPASMARRLTRTRRAVHWD
ncbi:predicted protein [Verticillium alfalfae VaMs.102]|uniref:Predicted protein n=1 Tax=Verticillium alfalfae (strain VaMs.102 / ATCC MYA-4576 / FGSC 10136) TaxID=526221 RepID=C9SPH1_VERA1|nr:predicted protein [Verticillium alfalfae VaMs.102]EEY20686.1 predicted protein [Verticillium alfalfae VaMs.102]